MCVHGVRMRMCLVCVCVYVFVSVFGVADQGFHIFVEQETLFTMHVLSCFK